MRQRQNAVAVLSGLAALLAGCSAGNEKATTSEAIPVLVRTVGTLNRTEVVAVSGDVAASRMENLGFQVAGRVVRVWPQEGDAVEAGAPLAQLDTTEYQLQLTMASATTRQAEDQYKRLQQMFSQQGIPPSDFVKIETGYQQAQAQQALVRKQLQDTRLNAPLGGIVARRGIEVGEMAAPGMPVFTIVETDPVKVNVGVPEAEIGKIRLGQRTEIHVPSLGSARFEGRVSLIGIAADPVSRTYTVKVTVPNPRRLLRPGMIAEARIYQDTRINALTVPSSAIVRDAEGASLVYVYFPNEKQVYARRVTVGSVYGKEVEVTQGLTGTESIVIGGQHRVREGSKVEATIAKSDQDASADKAKTP